MCDFCDFCDCEELPEERTVTVRELMQWLSGHEPDYEFEIQGIYHEPRPDLPSFYWAPILRLEEYPGQDLPTITIDLRDFVKAPIDRPGLASATDVVQHSLRFRPVSTRYPRLVAKAYGGDLARAMADTDEQVAATVAAWEQAEGIPARDWKRIGAEERDELAGA